MREYRYHVDRDGRIFHDGTEVIDPLVLAFFLRAMQQTPDGRYLVLCQGERNWFEAADTPFVIQRIGSRFDGDQVASVELHLAGDYHEPLDPSDLEVRGDHLYCRVRRGEFRARFGRRAIQQVAPLVAEAGEGLELRLGGARYPIHRLPPPSTVEHSSGGIA
jgi:hypothetical protein